MATVGQNIGQTLEEQNLEFYCDCIDRKRNEELKPLPGLVAQNFEEILKEQLAKYDPATLNYKLFELIQNNGLSPELRKVIYKELFVIKRIREIINKEYLTLRLRQRAALGWDKVHQDLQKTPFCHRRERLVKVMFCLEHESCGVDGICVPCIREDSINHYAFPDIDEYNSPRRCIEICDDDLEHAWILCMLRGLDPTREIFQ